MRREECVTPSSELAIAQQCHQGEAQTPDQSLWVGLCPPVLLPHPYWPPRSSDLPSSALFLNSLFLP